MTVKTLLIATRNPGKARELKDLLSRVPWQLVSLADVGIDVDVVETGSTYHDNALLKARFYCALSGLPTLADDSGLEVDALGGEPGVHSARFAGEGATDEQRIALLYERLKGIRARRWTARFRCVLAIVLPETVETDFHLFEGMCRGRIARRPRGDDGFGYDPVFLFPKFGKTMAEASRVTKNHVSHRSDAARKAAVALSRPGQIA